MTSPTGHCAEWARRDVAGVPTQLTTWPADRRDSNNANETGVRGTEIERDLSAGGRIKTL